MWLRLGRAQQHADRRQHSHRVGSRRVRLSAPAPGTPPSAKNIKWVAKLGSRSYGNAVVHNGKVFVGTQQHRPATSSGYPPDVDLGCLLCFDVKDGKFLWQHSSAKLPSGRVHDWPLEGVCSVPYCEGDRLWFVTNRGEVRCLDADGFLDDENDGESERAADVEARRRPRRPPARSPTTTSRKPTSSGPST